MEKLVRYLYCYILVPQGYATRRWALFEPSVYLPGVDIKELNSFWGRFGVQQKRPLKIKPSGQTV